jgi:N-acetylglucosaminyldiphosphoundecaprenol N-acetyl-beta-D-mannosaminyltransferase
MFGRVTMAKVDIAGLQVDAITKQEFLAEIEKRLEAAQKTFVVTPYSEFLYAALRDKSMLDLLNKADIAIPDGVGILWAERFLSLPFTLKNYYLKILQALWQVVYSGTSALLYPKSIYRTFPAKLTGADIVWDLAALAAEKNYSLYLLGGFDDTPQIAAQRLQAKFPGLKIAGASNKSPSDASVITDIQIVQPDILLVCYGPIRQEQWIVEHYNDLPIKLAIGLGGTFDYIAGKKWQPPRFIRASGLEWLYRLITQPTRVRRIARATVGLITALIRYKVFHSLGYRSNVVCVVFNDKKEILICQRNPEEKDLRSIGERNKLKYKNYWQFPQGGIDKGETVAQAAQRELQEETGIISANLIKISEQINRYEYTHARRPLLFNDAHRKGQEQQIAYFQFQGLNSEIRPDNEEFIAFRWVPAAELKGAVHPERWSIARIVLDDLQAGYLGNL